MSVPAQCPACRARLGAAPVCPRCGCDLTLARRAAAQARQLAAQAVRAWAVGNAAQARALAIDSLSLEQGLLARAVVRLCAEVMRQRGLG